MVKQGGAQENKRVSLPLSFCYAKPSWPCNGRKVDSVYPSLCMQLPANSIMLFPFISGVHVWPFTTDLQPGTTTVNLVVRFGELSGAKSTELLKRTVSEFKK
jgi:hypothetical protein